MLSSHNSMQDAIQWGFSPNPHAKNLVVFIKTIAEKASNCYADNP
jgi:hypothetical protein